jgi:hypothetical protein
MYFLIDSGGYQCVQHNHIRLIASEALETHQLISLVPGSGAVEPGPEGATLRCVYIFQNHLQFNIMIRDIFWKKN